MRHQLVITLKPCNAYPDGETLIVEYPDRDTAEAVLRSMDRYRRYRWGLADTAVTTVDGAQWCVSSYADVTWPVEIRPAPVPAPAS